MGNYGMTKWSDLFTERQLAALATFSGLVRDARERAESDAISAGVVVHDNANVANGVGESEALTYADAVAVYLGLALGKVSDYSSSLVLWSPTRDQVKTTFSRNALPMTWDFAEVNIFAGAAGDLSTSIAGISRTLSSFTSTVAARVVSQDAQLQAISSGKIISTDPPYYDNIGYADLSDFFYVWLRQSLRSTFPDLFATLVAPKAEELVATPWRHGGKASAEKFFLDGMSAAMGRLAAQAHPAMPVTIYYAFKQAESDGAGGAASTGWETFLDAVIRSGLTIAPEDIPVEDE